MTVFRIDAASLAKPELDADGVLHVQAYATRAGVFKYADPSGKMRAEYRPESEVFAEPSLQTVAGAPVTIGHVAMVTPENVRSLRVGVVETVPERDGALMAVKLRLDDPAVIDRVLKGELCELSLGYRCDVDTTPGVTPDGVRYDMQQRNIRMNHVALLGRGKARAGSVASIRLDAEDAQEVAPGAEEAAQAAQVAAADAASAAQEAVAAADVAASAASEASAAAEPAPNYEAMLAELNAVNAQLRERVASLESLLSQAVTRADSAEMQVFQADVRAAMPELDQTGKTPEQLRAVVVGRYLPQVRLDGASADYSRAMFDAAVSLARVAPRKEIAGNEIRPSNGAADARAERDARNRAACKVS